MNSSLFSLKDRVSLVTGGSRGLGKAIARAYTRAGSNIAICSRKEDDLKDALDEILEGTDVRGEYFVSDLSRREEAEQVAKNVLEAFGRVDILVNNAGTNIPEPIHEINDENWDMTMELNLNSCMALTRALAPQMMERRWGRIIYISSIMGLASKAGRNSYSATKSALIGLAKANALDLGSYNITANSIAPGPFLTELPDSLLTEEQKKYSASRTALGRWGDPEEIKGMALLLASDAGSYITGSTLVIDGGLLSMTF